MCGGWHGLGGLYRVLVVPQDGSTGVLRVLNRVGGLGRISGKGDLVSGL